MLKRKLGRTDLDVSVLCFGGNVFGWTADKAASDRVLDAFVEAGGNFVDSADVYSRWVPGNSGGESEVILGQWMKERGNRAGTENVAAIAGFGAACAAAQCSREADAARMAALRASLEAVLKASTPQAVIFGANALRLPNTTLVAVPGLKAETAIIAFDLNGVALSSGAACSSGRYRRCSTTAIAANGRWCARRTRSIRPIR